MNNQREYDNYAERHTKFSPENLPTTLKRKIYVHYEASGEISIWDADLSDSKRILLSEQLVTVKIPRHASLKEKMIDAIENEIETLQANTHKKVTELKGQISALLCIEYQPGSV